MVHVNINDCFSRHPRGTEVPLAGQTANSRSGVQDDGLISHAFKTIKYDDEAKENPHTGGPENPQKPLRLKAAPTSSHNAPQTLRSQQSISAPRRNPPAFTGQRSDTTCVLLPVGINPEDGVILTFLTVTLKPFPQDMQFCTSWSSVHFLVRLWDCLI
ncbi:hypothetical protein EYF80_032370 [Liparis tanakae]|uniref:Uncharacterized protein n=1 Tax=Liparis tanakae TaxID=230148 RepID=A0A4Z2GVM1_9TELE|nr:hypothetical protein EYF80_032370 [Liparis tanakae]